MGNPWASMERRLTNKQIKMINLMAIGISRQEVADTLNLTLRTIDRWAIRGDIKQAIDEAQSSAVKVLGEEIFEKSKAALTKSIPRAIRRLVESLDDPDGRIRLRASELLLKITGFYQPASINKPEANDAEVDLKRYISALEANISGNGNGNHQKTYE